jgi:hypothetical protein
MRVAPKILVLCGLEVEADMPRREAEILGARGLCFLWSFRGEFVVRCGRLNAKGCRGFRRRQPCILISTLIVAGWR